MDKEVQKTIGELNAPLLYSFSKFVLDSAQKKDLKKVYFLARDGYEPYLLQSVWQGYIIIPWSAGICFRPDWRGGLRVMRGYRRRKYPD